MGNIIDREAIQDIVDGQGKYTFYLLIGAAVFLEIASLALNRMNHFFRELHLARIWSNALFYAFLAILWFFIHLKLHLVNYAIIAFLTVCELFVMLKGKNGFIWGLLNDYV